MASISSINLAWSIVAPRVIASNMSNGTTTSSSSPRKPRLGSSGSLKHGGTPL